MVPYHPGIIPDLVRVSVAIPFVTDLKSYQWLWENTPWYTKYLKDMGLRPLYTCYQELIIATVKPIEDILNPSLKGRKIRAAGLGMKEVMEYLGADTITMPSPEVPAALATGLCEGLITTLDTWDAIGIQEVCPYVYHLNSPFATNHCMTEKRYQKLPDWAKKVVTEAGKETTKKQIEWTENYRKAVFDKFKGNAKIKFYVLNDEQMSAWKTTLKPFYRWLNEKFDPDMKAYLADCDKGWRATHDTPPPTIK